MPIFIEVTSHHHHQQRVDNFLFTQFKQTPKCLVYRLLRQGSIRLNQKRCKPSDRIVAGDYIKVPMINQASRPSSAISCITSSLKKLLLRSILFEDKNLLVLNKPHGLAVHGGSGITQGIIEALRQLYPTDSYLELAHRLDRDTSGCLVIARKPSILKALHLLFREGRIRKTYLMLVKGQWPATLRQIDVPLKKNYLKSGERVVVVHPAGKSTLTQCQLEQSFSTTSLVKVILKTGRTHQIRVHAKHVQYPIVGDEKYGDPAFTRTIFTSQPKRLCLHAYTLAFTLPQLAPIQVKAPLPESLSKLLQQQREQVKNTEGGT